MYHESSRLTEFAESSTSIEFVEFSTLTEFAESLGVKKKLTEQNSLRIDEKTSNM